MKKMKAYHEYLKKTGWLENDDNLRQNIPTKPSYSMMHSLEDCFQTVMYSCTHNTRVDGQLKIHKNHAIRLILAPAMTVIWNEATLYSASKSREYITDASIVRTHEDMHLFNYSWYCVENESRNRSSGHVDGVAREYGDGVYRETIHRCTCPQLYSPEPSSCLECGKPETVIDLRDVATTSYDSGHRIVGDLKRLGWVVVRGVRMTTSQRKGIRDIANIGNKRQGGTWHPMENQHKNMKMKYNHNSPRHKQWDIGAVNRYLEVILGTVIKKVLPPGYGIIREKLNLFKYIGKVESDQRLHTDYPSRTNV